MQFGRSVITGKGQVQIPAKIGQALGLSIDEEVVFKLDDRGKGERKHCPPGILVQVFLINRCRVPLKTSYCSKTLFSQAKNRNSGSYPNY